MSRLLKAVALLQESFNKYAGEDGDAKSLSKAELVKLLKAELPGLNPEKQKEVDDFFKMLDNDKDGAVDFSEYVTFAAALAVLLDVGK